MLSGGGSDSDNSGDGTARTADERRQPMASGPRGQCTCEPDDGFFCPGCQNLQFAKHVEQTKVFVGGVDCKTRLLKRINGGSFGDVYLGAIEEKTGQVAVKMEIQTPISQQLLLYEGNVYRKLEGGPGIPTVHWFGMHGSKYNVLVMDLMGPSLQDVFKRCHHKFSLKSVLQIIDQVLGIIEHVHTQGFVHRDISPNNFMFGRGEDSQKVFLIDYGHAKKFSTGLPYRSRSSTVTITRPLVGTPRYAAVHAHLGHEAACRDDLEALGYLWVYLLKGKLPWQGLHIENMQEKLCKVGQMKMKYDMQSLCKDLPQEFAFYLEYTRHLKPFETADYSGLQQMFRNLARQKGLVFDGVFDWSDCAERTPLAEITSATTSRQQEDAREDLKSHSTSRSTCSSLSY